MTFTNEYTTVDKIDKEDEAILKDNKLIPVEIDKTVLTNDAYAIGNLLQSLISQIEKARISLR